MEIKTMIDIVCIYIGSFVLWAIIMAANIKALRKYEYNLSVYEKILEAAIADIKICIKENDYKPHYIYISDESHCDDIYKKNNMSNDN